MPPRCDRESARGKNRGDDAGAPWQGGGERVEPSADRRPDGVFHIEHDRERGLIDCLRVAWGQFRHDRLDQRARQHAGERRERDCCDQQG